jgi:hypothetical protein
MRRMCSIKAAVAVVAATACTVATPSAQATAPASVPQPWWQIHQYWAPTDVQAGGEAQIDVLASNVGDANAQAPVTLREKLPQGLTVKEVGFRAEPFELPSYDLAEFGLCEQVGREVSCKYPTPVEMEPILGPLSVLMRPVNPFWSLEMLIVVNVEPGAHSGEQTRASVEGGGASTTDTYAITVGEGTAPFGVNEFSVTPEEVGGRPDERAGSHPFQLTTTLGFNVNKVVTPADTVNYVTEQPRNLIIKLPQGLVGNPTPLPQCTGGQFATRSETSGEIKALGVAETTYFSDCPADTVVGVATVRVEEPQFLGLAVWNLPVFNLQPEPGEPARFGFEVGGTPVYIDTSVRTGEDYGVTVTVHNTPQTLSFIASSVTLWGDPGDPVHDSARGSACLYPIYYPEGACGEQSRPRSEPFLTMPTSCAEPLQASMTANSWHDPAYLKELGSVLQESLEGCNAISFAPEIGAAPDVKNAASPSGLTVNVHVPQEAALNPNGVAESAVKRIEVTLPEGVTVNPGGAEGLQACSETQIGFKGSNAAAVGGFEFTPTYPSCPEQSKIATVTIHTPLLPNPLEGFVYLATPSINGEAGDNPYNSLIAMYLVAEDPVSGTLVKLPMHVELNPTTGQLVTTVENPELPFEDAELHFFGGSRAPLATPALCGTYTTNAVFTPWSGNAPVDSSTQFTIVSGPGGGSCLQSSPRPFAPEFQAGMTNIQAGAFTPFTTTLGHPDGDQPLAAVTMKMPPGLSGSLTGVTLCPEPQASLGTCGAESLIGHTVVTAGLGSSPAVVARPGDVYITGPYNGHGSCKVGEPGCAPFGLSIANPAETGPFDLEKGTPCDCVVVRAKVEVNPLTAQLTVTSDPLPTILKGIPLNLQHVNVTIDRPNFMFNPTNCAKMAIAGSISGGEGALAPVSTPFQVANCATLPFKAGFSALTQAHHTRADGDSLHVVVTSSAGQANIAKIRVELPKVLPSRLTTLQKACTEAQFASDPAGCPAGSIVGHATIHTPLVPVPLEGPAYFVSHGGAKFPELVMVLQGYGVTVELKGETFISKAGVTSSTFNSIPDTPFTRSELVLPAASNSALAANGNLCADKLVMPTTLTAQNGAVIKQDTKIAVTGCKSTVTVVRHSVKGSKATVVVSVPTAGKLIVTGDGLVGGIKTLRKAGEATVDLSLSKQQQLLLARHPDRKLKVRVHLLFEPAHGSHLSASVTLLMR